MHNSGIVCERRGFSWSQTVNSDFLIFNERFINTTKADYSNVFIGFFFDFDIPKTQWFDDLVGYIDSLGLGYMYDGGPDSTHIGYKILNPTNPIGLHYLDAISVPGDDIMYYNLIRHTNPPPSPPTTQNDYKLMLCTGPFVFNAGDTLDIAIGVAAGFSLDHMINSAINMQNVYDSFPVGVEEESVLSSPENFHFELSPNPTTGFVNCSFTLPANSFFDFEIYDIQGRLIKTLGNHPGFEGNNSFSFDITNLNQGMYFIRIKTSNLDINKRLILLK